MLVKFQALSTVYNREFEKKKKKSQLSWSLQSSGLMNLSLMKDWEESIADSNIIQVPSSVKDVFVSLFFFLCLGFFLGGADWGVVGLRVFFLFFFIYF